MITVFTGLIRYSGVAGVILLWTTTLLAMRRIGLGLVDARPLSHLGIEPWSSMLFSTGLLVSSALFIIFAVYAKKAYRANQRFLVYFLIGQAGQIIVAIAPYGMNSSYRLVHTVAAFTLAFSLPFLIREFARSQSHIKYSKLFRYLFLLELVMFVVGIGIFTMTSGIAPIGEILPAVGFHIWIIAATLFAGAGKSAVLNKSKSHRREAIE